MPIRNPFKRAPGVVDIDDTSRQGADGEAKDNEASSKPIEIPKEYKLCGMSFYSVPSLLVKRM